MNQWVDPGLSLIIKTRGWKSRKIVPLTWLISKDIFCKKQLLRAFFYLSSCVNGVSVGAVRNSVNQATRWLVSTKIIPQTKFWRSEVEINKRINDITRSFFFRTGLNKSMCTVHIFKRAKIVRFHYLKFLMKWIILKIRHMQNKCLKSSP
jgi:hypothetical protein